MKNIIKTTIAFLVILTATMVSCSSEEAAVSRSPYISYVRVTDPVSSDSLIASAGQGQLLALIGGNLANTVEVWFNNRQSYLKPTLVSNNSIITNVPNKIPTEINNEIRLVDKFGGVYTYNFKVDIGKPYLKEMLSEYVQVGKIATIKGDYFYAPLTVTFTGGVSVNLTSIEDEKILNVEVPAGAMPGPITVTSNFGSTISDFWFRDNRNIFVSSDPFKGYSGAEYVVTTPGSDAPVAINGNYIRINKAIGDFQWTPFAEGSPQDFGAEGKAIPDAAILHPEDYYLKFEINTQKPFNNNGIKLQVAMADGIVADNLAYFWNPPFDTKGKWETVVISFDEVLKKITPKVSAQGYFVRLLVHGKGSLDADMSFDNFRVVPKNLNLN
ncbi:glycan-binding surface protein [Flavobacterium sp. TMP13]|uniref:glycan-binding surface protein n=1 Tax=Flavobacterium sp. TMP13 TaxID=3425950 RepID=UPI003D7842E9